MCSRRPAKTPAKEVTLGRINPMHYYFTLDRMEAAVQIKNFFFVVLQLLVIVQKVPDK